MTQPADPTKPMRIGISIRMGQPFGHHHGCYKGIQEYVREHRPDWEVVVDPYLVGLAKENSVAEYDGIIGRLEREPAEQAKELGIPVVNHWLNTPAEGLPGVYTDFEACGRMVGEHLLAQGYKRLALISWESDRARPLYLSGLQSIASERGIGVQTLDVPYSFEDDPDEFKTFYRQLRETLKSAQTPLGIFVPMDAMAVYAVQACDELGLMIPHDIGLVVAYNALELCLNTRPTLTAIETSNAKIGYEAMRLLDKLISGEAVDTSEPVWIEPKTVRVRGSSEVFVSEDPVVSKAMRFIADHARSTIGVEDVAEAAGVSKRTLSRRFEEHVGLSVHGEISRVRVQAIKQALVDTDLPIAEVAEECGFSTTSHFNVFFRKSVGTTPGAYRRSHRAD